MDIERKKLFICITKSQPWGGAQKYVFDIATNTPRDQFDTTVLLGGLPALPAQAGQAGDGELTKKLMDAGVKTTVLENSQRDISIKKEFGLFFELLKIFKREKPDIIHLNSSKMGFVGALAGRIAGIKNIVFIAHGWAFNEKRNFFSKIIFRCVYILTILLAHKTIAVSGITKKQMGWPFNRNMVIIRNGVREINFKDKKTAQGLLTEMILEIKPKASSIISTSPSWIGTISELHTTKGLEYAIEAISKTRMNVIFVVIGEGENRKKLEELSVKLGIAHRVFLIGYKDSASSYLKAFDIVTLSSITEALPYMLLEAGCATLPIIASKVGGIPEIIENDKTGILIPSKNSEQIKNSIEFLIKNPEKAKYFGDNLKEKISKNFTQKIMLEKTFAIYRK